MMAPTGTVGRDEGSCLWGTQLSLVLRDTWELE